MKALAALALVFVSSYCLAQTELAGMTYGGCNVYHPLVSKITRGTWTGACGTGSAEGFGRFTYYFADNIAHSDYMEYKDGKPVNAYVLASDPVKGNRLLKTNADYSTTVLKDCGAKPDPACASIINGAYESKNEWFLDNQKIKGSYSGPKNYPGITRVFTSSGGISPPPAAFVIGAEGIKVTCDTPSLTNLLAAAQQRFKLSSSEPCEKQRETGRYNYYYLTSLELSCPVGIASVENEKANCHTRLNNAIAAAKKACGN
jgi:hypothetical protein